LRVGENPEGQNFDFGSIEELWPNGLTSAAPFISCCHEVQADEEGLNSRPLGILRRLELPYGGRQEHGDGDFNPGTPSLANQRIRRLKL
jgi:hypothetical protein